MPVKHKKTIEIQDFIIHKVTDHPADIARVTAEKFGLSRVAVANHLRFLVRAGLLEASGQTKARRHTLKIISGIKKVLQIDPSAAEHDIWLTIVKPCLIQVKNNVLDICFHGFTEMFNNVVDHSESTTCEIIVARDAANIRVVVRDFGVGIFNKIQHALKLQEPQHAILELSKGKLTTDKSKHSGEGIFFTSRMFDCFSIVSGTLIFGRLRDKDDWIFQSEQAPIQGTEITMFISTDANQTMKEVFDHHTAEFDEFGFSKTNIPLVLLKYEGEQLISRSQAKRLMAHVDKFMEVLLDFKGITMIGQAFSDEIFRIYRREHPSVHVYPINMTKEIVRMIQRVIAEDPSDPLNEYLRNKLLKT